MSQSPKEIVQELDKYIIGQKEAKRAVAIALRNRWRRTQLDEKLRAEISPKNILMIGPTGVGKTEMARRLAKMTQSPFIKVEATKFTEVGYVGRDVESIIRDLVDMAFKTHKAKVLEKVKDQAAKLAEERILDALVSPEPKSENSPESETRQLFRKKLRARELDDKEISIEVTEAKVGVEIMAPPGMEEMTNQLQSMFSNLNNGKQKRRRLKVCEAFRLLQDEEANRLVNEDEIKVEAVAAVEENGIVFLDEIDKVAKRSGSGGQPDISREGVQRDLLPLIEGSMVNTKYGTVKTDHILFIASGAFHVSKPSDLIPELQGRLPVRVEFKALTAADFERILIEPDYALTLQYQALLQTENLSIVFQPDAIEHIAQAAWLVNERTDNIGARRLHTVLEKLLEDISFNAQDLAKKHQGKPFAIDAAYVDKFLSALIEDRDLSRYIL